MLLVLLAADALMVTILLCGNCFLFSVQTLLTGSLMKPVTPALPARLPSLSSGGSIIVGAVERYDHSLPV